MASPGAVRLRKTLKLPRFCAGIGTFQRNTYGTASISEYTAEPEYPPIIDTSREATRRRNKDVWHEKIKNLATVEQKFVELNMPKYYGYWSCHLKDTEAKINGLDFLKYATRTHIVESLPDNYYFDVKSEAEKLASDLQDKVEALIDLHFNGREKMRSRITANFFLGLHRILNGALSPTVEHLKDSVVDVDPRIEAFWFLGGIQPDKMLKKTRRNNSYCEDMENDLIDRPMQASSTPSLGIRVNHGLPEVVELDHELSSTSIPIANLDPRAYGYKFRHKHATTTTAFWPGENREYCHLWMLSLANIKSNIRNLGEHNYGSIIQQKMILASFTQALAHASYLGFGPVTELTYPIVQQSLLSDGQKWYLSVFQMNTCALHSERAAENPVSNILWLNNEQQLFEVVDETGVKGFNPEVLSNIICMYLKKGTERENPTPYLAPYKYLAKFPAPEEYRDDFHRTLLQYIYSGRPRPTARPEIYNWEKIYKVDFKTRLYEPPRRFFEPHFNQWHPGRRRFDDYKPPYIVKAHRDKKSPRNKPRIDTEHLYKYD